MLNSVPWIEKYRPQSMEDIILESTVVNQIRIFIKDIQNTHLILTGLPGVGKTSTVRCIAKEILGDSLIDGYRELNAGEDRGTKSITSIIPPFCEKKVNFSCSKIILLDEADNMTDKCQCDISEMIKKYGTVTKFIFTCNDSSKITEDIQSVCRIIRYPNLTSEQVFTYLIKICEQESIVYTTEGLNIIYYISNGDMRKSINDLQKTAYTFGKITRKAVLKICQVPDPQEIETILQLCFIQQFEKADQMVINLIGKGYYYLDIVNGFNYVLIKMQPLEESLRLKMIKIINDTKIVISMGLKSKLQLSAMIARLIEQIK